jgi:hypothetical protein
VAARGWFAAGAVLGMLLAVGLFVLHERRDQRLHGQDIAELLRHHCSVDAARSHALLGHRARS